MTVERRQHETTLPPYERNLEAFAPAYTPERFTSEEKYILEVFFTNWNKPIFCSTNLPEEVSAALASRYSRARGSVRRIFLNEYVAPVLYPDWQADWGNLQDDEKTVEDIKTRQQEAHETRKRFIEFVDFLHTNGGMDKVVNVQRARKFFSKWLAEFGDDSIAEEGNAHIFIEGISNLVVNTIEAQRIGLSPLEKSSRYVSFADKRPNGEWQYVVPGEIIGTPLEAEYREVMDLLFSTYAAIEEPYLDYIKELYPRGEDETRGSFERSRGAKRFDDIRDLLPFATQTNLALNGNGRAFENLINRMLDHELGEVRYWGQAICNELNSVVPSFVERPKTKRGAEVQTYRGNLDKLGRQMAVELDLKREGFSTPEKWATCVDWTHDADKKILTAFLFKQSNLSYSRVRWEVDQMSREKRARALKRILDERKLGRENADRAEVRFRKPHRAWENAHYLFEMWARAGDYRDLHRHRQQTQDRQLFTVRWGYNIEKELENSPFASRVLRVFDRVTEFFRKAEVVSPDLAQYAVPLGALQHWYSRLSAREIYWIVELRTGPQGRPHYREVCQQIADEVLFVDPAVFVGMMVDRNDYSLARRESEIKTDKKLERLGTKREQ